MINKMNEKGSISVLVAFLMVILLGFFGLAVDYGITVYEKVNLENAIDAAVLAGSLELPNKDNAEAVALDYLAKNNVSSDSVEIITTNESIKITKAKTINHHIMPLLGINTSNISVTSKASIFTIGEVNSGTRPFGVVDQSFNYGDQIDLKVNAEGSKNGNFGALQLGSMPGANIFREHVLYGYDGKLEIGDQIYTEPGNMSMIINPVRQMINSNSDTFNDYERDSDRLWTIPVLSDFDVQGRSEVEIIGFAQFFLEDVGKQSGQTKITGRFIKYVKNGNSLESANNYGLYTSKLTQ